MAWALPLCLLALCPLLTSCSEEDDTEEEFVDWQERNMAYFNNLYQTTKAKIDAGDTTWKIIPSWQLVDEAATLPTDYIIVHVLKEGTGSGCPIYTDKVRVHYQGRLLPSASYSGGYVFDSSWTGTFDPETAKPFERNVSGLIDGWITALEQMHIGDHWMVYIPYTLGYGTTGSPGTATSLRIPGYSTLIFDMTLQAYWRSDADVPDLKAKQGQWIEE